MGKLAQCIRAPTVLQHSASTTSPRVLLPVQPTYTRRDRSRERTDPAVIDWCPRVICRYMYIKLAFMPIIVHMTSYPL
ncbi:hypothetical protein OPQ81_011772 [Rhizoctonia solani]|nr:hypothetical protein OPQ81_011772 [Rhizoctonia solani]